VPGTSEAWDDLAQSVAGGDPDGDGAMWLLPAGPKGLLAEGSSAYGAAALGAPAHAARFAAVIDE
jgi:hypothetical protein